MTATILQPTDHHASAADDASNGAVVQDGGGEPGPAPPHAVQQGGAVLAPAPPTDQCSREHQGSVLGPVSPGEACEEHGRGGGLQYRGGVQGQVVPQPGASVLNTQAKNKRGFKLTPATKH